MAERGLLIVVSGPSGVGKGAVLQKIVDSDPAVAYSISVTTRPKRPGEHEGVNYFYKTETEFDRLVANGEILEWDVFCGNKYGTPRSALQRYIEMGKDIVLDLTVPGAQAVKAAFPEDSISIFLLPPSVDALKNRIRNRKGETEEQLEERVRFALEKELHQISCFDYVLVNDILEETVENVRSILKAERLRFCRNNTIVLRQLNIE